MTERTQHPGRREVTDAELVQGIRAGDGRAIAMLYDRYSDRIHGFCHSRLRDVADAADATHDTFVAAVQRIDQLRDPERLRPWLYTIAQRHALATFRSRSRSTPMDDLTTLTDPTADTADAELQRAALIELVWDAAEGLEDRDQLVLDLHLRHDLAGEELADALGVARDHAYTLASRARSRLGRAVGALVVARHGRAECRVLDDLLRDWTGGLSTTVRDSINKHVDRCEVCGERRSRLTDPAAMFAAVPMVAAPAALRSDVLTSLGVSAPGTTAGAAAPATVSSVALKLGALTLVAGGVIGGAIVVAGSLSTSGDSAAGEVMQAQEPPDLAAPITVDVPGRAGGGPDSVPSSLGAEAPSISLPARATGGADAGDVLATDLAACRSAADSLASVPDPGIGGDERLLRKLDRLRAALSRAVADACG